MNKQTLLNRAQPGPPLLLATPLLCLICREMIAEYPVVNLGVCYNGQLYHLKCWEGLDVVQSERLQPGPLATDSKERTTPPSRQNPQSN